MKKFQLSWTLRLCVSAAVLAILLWIVPARQLGEAMSRVSAPIWAAVVGGFLLGHLISAGKWWLLISHSAQVPLSQTLRAHFAGLLANLCLPGVAGGDVVRAAWIVKGVGHLERVGVGGVADRLLDSLGLLMLASLGAFWSLEYGVSLAGPLVAIAAALTLAMIGLFFGRFMLAKMATNERWEKLRTALDELTSRPGRLAVCLSMSLAVQGSFVGLNVLLARAAGLDVPASAWLLAWPLAKLVAIVPVSLAGLGVRESSLVALMAPFGAPAAAVTAVGLMWEAVLIVGGLVGGAVVLFTRGASRSASELNHKSPALAEEAAA